MCSSHPVREQRTTGEARLPSRVAAPLLALLVGALTGCGGRVTGDEATIHGPPTQDGGASQGEGGASFGVLLSAAGEGGSTGGFAGSSGQAGGATEGCEVSEFWYRVKGPVGFVLGQCNPEICTIFDRTVLGSVTLDAAGAVVLNTALSEADEEAWIEEMADRRWPCLAGQTMEYCCISA